VNAPNVDEGIATGWRGLDESVISSGHALMIANARLGIGLVHQRGWWRHRRHRHASGCHEPGRRRRQLKWWRKSRKSWQA
jgi:hypothetical protein